MISLDDKLLMYLSLKWNEAEFDEHYLINNYLSLYYYYYNIEKLESKLKHKDLFSQFLLQIELVLDDYSKKLLSIKPSQYKNDFKNTYEIQQDFEKILMTMGKEYYREHDRHSKRVYFLGKLLIDRLELKLLKDDIKDFWFLTASMHDYCYILQDISEIFENIKSKISKSLPNLNFILNYDTSLGDIYASEKHIEIFKKLSTYNDEIRYLDYISYLEKATKRDHGLLSALFIYDILIYQNKYPLDKIINIVNGIALHTLGNNPSTIDYSENSLSALLVYCDEIQEWNRPFVNSSIKNNDKIEIDNIDMNKETWSCEIEDIINIDNDKFKELSISQSPDIKLALYYEEIGADCWDMGIKFIQEESGDESNRQNIAIDINKIIKEHIRNLDGSNDNEDIFFKDIQKNVKILNNKALWKVSFMSNKNNIQLNSNIKYLKYIFTLYLYNNIRINNPDRKNYKLNINEPIHFIISQTEEYYDDQTEKKIEYYVNKKKNNLKRIINLPDDYKKIRISYEKKPLGNANYLPINE